MRFACTRTYFWHFIFRVSDNPEIKHLSIIDGREISENNTATIQCKVESNPLSNVEWTFENKPLNESNHGVLQSSYTIQKAKCVDTGLYMCRATNIINLKSYNDKRVVQLSVKCKYIMLTVVSSIKHNIHMHCPFRFVLCTLLFIDVHTWNICTNGRYCVSSNQMISAQASASQIYKLTAKSNLARKQYILVQTFSFNILVETGLIG
jgi:hypothetical protein